MQTSNSNEIERRVIESCFYTITCEIATGERFQTPGTRPW